MNEFEYCKNVLNKSVDTSSMPDVIFLQETRFWIQRVLTPIVVFVGLIGNLVTIIVLTRHRMKSSTNIYLTALAVSDLIYLVFFFLLSLQHYAGMDVQQYYIYWRLLPYIYWPTDASSGTSIWLTVSFTLERYIAVCHPLRGRVLCTESRAKKVIFYVAAFNILSTITTQFEWEICYKTNTTLSIQYTEFGENEIYTGIYYWFTAFIFVYIPLAMLCVLNTLLIKAVQNSQMQRTGLTQVINCAGNTHRVRQENKITKALVAVVLLFIVCQIPTTIWLILGVFYKPEPKTPEYHYNRALANIFNILMAVNAATNFILYCVMSDKYRRTLLITFFPCYAKHHRTFTMSSMQSYQNSVRNPRNYSFQASIRDSTRHSSISQPTNSTNIATRHPSISTSNNHNRLRPPSVRF